ncbi:hypothetical protein MTR_1g080475 [Medicago truncatula]|uniref:Uncharacterized protein n=1 Tax=Medicago truncatula TaxID=3880 RepID=A0A072VY51_MEDTR|nr:hypothetical protein MTR_1g080475 [Medicago truncatula]
MSEKPYQFSVRLMNVKNPELYALTTTKTTEDQHESTLGASPYHKRVTNHDGKKHSGEKLLEADQRREKGVLSLKRG